MIFKFNMERKMERKMKMEMEMDIEMKIFIKTDKKIKILMKMHRHRQMYNNMREIKMNRILML